MSENMTARMVSFASGHPSGSCSGYLVGPADGGKEGLVVGHEWWGLQDSIKRDADSIAVKGGFVVIVPDLYHGGVTEDYEEAGRWMRDLDWRAAVLDLEAAAKYLRSLGCERVGVTGFSLGGALSIAAACRGGPDIQAAASFYGIPISNTRFLKPDTISYNLEDMQIPLQLHCGKYDTCEGFSAPTDFQTLCSSLDEAGKLYEFLEYPAKHAFANCGDPKFDKENAELAIEKLISFMKKHLK